MGINNRSRIVFFLKLGIGFKEKGW